MHRSLSLRLFAPLLCALLAITCSTEDALTLRVTSPLPSGIIARDTVLAFRFSRGVVPAESLNTWTSTPFIDFSPAVPGKFTWEDTTRLIFSPDGPFPGDARISGKLNTGLLTRISGAKGFKGPDGFEFTTERFTMRGAEFFYDRLAESRRIGVKANLEFSYLVDPRDLGPRLTVTVDGTRQEGVRIMTTDRNRIIAVELGAVTQTDRERKIQVNVSSDLVSPETGTRITMESPFVFTLAPLGDLKVYGHEAGFDGATGWVRVRTSQEVDVATVKNFVRFDPNKDFTVTGGGNSFVLHGKFQPGTTMKMTIAPGLESVLGGKLQNAYEADVFIGNIPPSYRFASETGVYMLLGGEKKLDIRTINVPRLNIRVSQVFQNNLVYFIQNGRYYDYDWSSGEEGEDSSPALRKYRYSLGNFGRQLSFDTLALQGPDNQEITTLLDLNPYLHTGYRGFYLVEIAGTAEAWRTNSKLVSISDLGMIVKRNPDGAMVFVTSLESTDPVNGAVVNLVSTNNQVVASEKTDGDGVARFTGLQAKMKDFPLMLVTAELENDFNFLTLDDYKIETSRYDVGGKHESEAVYDALLYGDRNLYRPGETVVVSGIVRNLTRAVPASMPVKLKVVNPRGTTVAEQQLALNTEGSFETTFPTRQTGLTGDYHFDLYTGSGLYLTGYKASVEDFVPDRLRVNLTPSRERASAGQTITYELTAHNFFGPPAANRNWQFEASLDPAPYVSKAFPDFRFANDAAKNATMQPLTLEGKTDQNGRAEFAAEIPSPLESTGMLRMIGKVAVFDESGRPVYQRALTLVDPRPYYIGVRNRGAYYVSPNVPQKMQIIAVDPSDTPIRGFRARVDLIRLEWHSVLRQHGSDKTLRYVSERREIPVSSEVITIGNGPQEYAYSAPRSGDYEVRVSKQGDAGYNKISFYSYSWGTTDVTSFEVDPEARIDIVLDKPRYAPGDRAKVLFQTPFSGRMLVTVERNGVYLYKFLDVANNAASMDLNVEENYLPNVYLTAVLFRKIRDNNIPLLVGHGFVPLMVERSSDKLEVAIKAPEKIRPRTKQTVTVSIPGEKNVSVTLAAVDEGILQLKNFKTPDPYGYFYARKALETGTYDFFKYLIPEPVRKQTSSVGGSEAELGKRVNPLSVQRVKPVAFWSGIRRTNGSGEVQVTLDIPDFNGEIRLMAIAYKGDRFGSAQQPMTSADPYVVTPALPRFLSPGDSISMAITAFNTTAQPVSLKFDVSTTGSIGLSERPGTLDIAPNQESFVLAGLRASRAPGKATVTVKTATPEGTVESSTDLPVRPASPFVTDAITGALEAGHTVSQPVSDAYMTETRRSYVTISPFPVGNFAGRLKNLLGYPYGCLEQIVSKAFPQLYLRDIATLLAPTALANGSPTYYVNEAIGILGTLQTPEGSFLYWPGGSYTNEWTTVYAAHFLLEARKAGYAVPDALLKPALNAVAAIARGRKTMDYYSWHEGKTTVRRIADKSVVYALYVLAVAGAPDRSVMDFYQGDRSLLTPDSRTMVAAAYALIGDRRAYGEMLPPSFTLEEPVRTSGEDFDSPVRANALILNLLLDTDLNNVNIPRYMDYLSRRYGQDRWFSTQDDAFTLLAFGKAARMATATKLTGTVSAGGKSFTYNGGTQKFDVNPFGSAVSISVQGEGRAYYSVVAEGIRTDGGIKQEDRNLQVRRDYLDRTGNPVSISRMRQNDLVIVRVTLRSPVDLLENIAVSDLLPAGFEIENPRLTQMTNYPFIKDAATPEYMDVRDDRINFYTGFHGNRNRQAVFYYAMRAVTPGSFTYAPIVAEAMYNGDYYSASGATTVTITR